MTIMRSLSALLIAPLAVGVLTLAACSSAGTGSDPASAAVGGPSVADPDTPDSAMTDGPAASEDPMADAEMAASAGSFITFEQYEAGKDMYADSDVVLFFNASWCPDCQATVASLESEPDMIPSGLTVVSVDYDTSDELKQRYGVTVQHTFVQVDADGNEVGKWTGTFTAAEIAEKTT